MTRIAMVDSGLGGLTVYREVARLLPQVDLLYFADNAAFPYGRLTEESLIERVALLAGRIIESHAPDLVVLACNTASTLSLPVLRARFSVPFVGIVPAIKPACALTKTGRISILATPGTVARDYTRNLIAEYAKDCRIDLVGSAVLAGYAESELSGKPVSDALIKEAILPAFHEGTDTIVLACTHYPLLLERLRTLAPWPVTWIDPAPAIARRVASLVHDEGDGGRRFFFTSPVSMPDSLHIYGFRKAETEALPFATPSVTTPAS